MASTSLRTARWSAGGSSSTWRRRFRSRAVFGESVSRTGLTPRSSLVEQRRARARSTRSAPRGLRTLRLVVGDHTAQDHDRGGQLFLGTRLYPLGEAGNSHVLLAISSDRNVYRSWMNSGWWARPSSKQLSVGPRTF